MSAEDVLASVRALVSGEPDLVAGVRQFPGHIACDGDSRAELVVPVVRDGRLVGVLDLDSPEIGRFNSAEKDLAEGVARLVADSSAP
ncbi:MAG: GAF domain-containing protein [Elusimicrobiota bacterium]